MLRIYNRQVDMLESLLHPELKELPKELKIIDEILSDTDFTEPFERKLREKVKEGVFSEGFGRPTTFIASYVRLMYLKFRYQLSYEELLEDVRYNIAKRLFCGLSLTEPLPDDTTLIKLTHKLGEDFIKELFEAIVKEAHNRKFIQCKKARIDTFVLKSNIHYPTDASLLYDGIRVIGALSKRLKRGLSGIKERLYNYRTKAKRILLKLNLKLKDSDAIKEGLLKTKPLEELIHLAKRSISKARRLIEASRGFIKDKGVLIQKTHKKLNHFIELTERIVSQTKAIMAGAGHVKDRIVSIFDEGARPIKKGKTFPKVEFGRKVVIVEGEFGILTHLQAFEGNPNDQTLLLDAVRAQQEVAGHIPSAIATDRGFYDPSGKVEEELRAIGVRRISIPQRGYKDHKQKRRERSKWFRELQRWRAAQEAKISHLIRRFGMGKSLMRGRVGANLWLYWGGFASNLWQMARLVT